MLAGWGTQPIDEVEAFDALPDPARRYVEFVEAALEVEVPLVGTGAEREQVLVRSDAAFALA